MQLKFKKTIFRSGNSYAVLLPMDYVQQYKLKPGKEYEFTIEVLEK